MNKKGYTLLELLLTSVLFVGIAMLSTGAFTQILRAPVASQQYRLATEQVNGLLDEIESDLQSASKTEDPNYKGRVWLYSLNSEEQANEQVEAWPGNEVLITPIFRSSNVDDAEWRMYCVTNTGVGTKPGVQRMVRYVTKAINGGNFVKPSQLPLHADAGCGSGTNEDKPDDPLKFFVTDSLDNPVDSVDFVNYGGVLGSIERKDLVEVNLYPNLAVNSLSFTPVWFDSSTIFTKDTILKPDAIRIDIVAHYNDGDNPEKRVAGQVDTISRPIVMRRIVSLKQAYEHKAQ